MKKHPRPGDHEKAGMEEATPCNLVLLGAEGVGKSTILQQFLKKTFRHDYAPTTLETFLHSISVDGDVYRLHLCDCSGSRGFSEHRAPYLTEANGVMLVYSTTDKNSLAHLLECAKEVFSVRQQRGVKKKIPFLLVGTKADVVEHRAVTIYEANRVAEGCLMALGLKVAKSEQKTENKGGCIKGGSECGLFGHLPVLEVSGTNAREVSQGVHIMIRMVRYFRATSRLPRLGLLCPGVETGRDLSGEANVDADSGGATIDTSPNGRFTPVTPADLPAAPHRYASPMTPSGSDLSTSYSPRSVGVTQSVRSSGAEEEGAINHPYLQRSDDAEVILHLPPPLRSDASVKVFSGNKTQVSSSASDGVSERRAPKVGPTYQQCPRCHVM